LINASLMNLYSNTELLSVFYTILLTGLELFETDGSSFYISSSLNSYPNCSM